jgi:prepilin-type N-terminal cleavage/methylation domain-containing protein
MSTKNCPNFKASGFTLIELLIVIALLGAIAVGMLAAVDPLEQIKKGTDTATRNTVSEVYNAMIRYYAIKTKFPWTVLDDATTVSSQNLNGADASRYIDEVITSGELKTDFKALAGSTRLDSIIMYAPSADNLTVCFQPASKSFQVDPNTKWTSEGSDYTGTTYCKSETGGTHDCWWCVK